MYTGGTSASVRRPAPRSRRPVFPRASSWRSKSSPPAERRAMTRDEVFAALGLSATNPGAFAGRWLETSGGTLEVENPTTATTIATGAPAPADDYGQVVRASQ